MCADQANQAQQDNKDTGERGVSKTLMDDLFSLAMQLNRQAFARPPVEGWLNSFLAMIYERFPAIKGIQAVQVIGNVAVQMGSAGNVPGSTDKGEKAAAPEQYTLDDSSPIATTIRTRQMAAAPHTRVYPIMIGDDVLGALIAYTVFVGGNSEAVGPIDDALGALSLQLGPALVQQLRTPGPQTGRLTRQIEMLHSLYEASKTVSSGLEGTEMLNHAARSLVETFHVEHASIVLFDYARSIGTCIGEFPDSGHVGTRLQLRNYPVQERLEREHAPIIIRNVSESKELGANYDLLVGLGLKSTVILPMMVQDELVGSVGLDSYYEQRDLTNDEIDAAMAITTQLASSVRNAQLYDEIKRRASQLERIADLGRRVTSTFDRREIFEVVKEQTQNLIDSNLISVALRPQDSDTMQLFILNNNPKPAEFKADLTALRAVIQSMEPVVLDDISGSEYPDYKLLSQMGGRAAVIVPLVVGGRAIGAYCVIHNQPGSYSSIDLAVVEQVGNQLAIALENARLYTQAEQRVEIEQLMNRMSRSIDTHGDMQGTLMATVQQIAEALKARRARVRLQMPSDPPATTERKG